MTLAIHLAVTEPLAAIVATGIFVRSKVLIDKEGGLVTMDWMPWHNIKTGDPCSLAWFRGPKDH